MPPSQKVTMFRDLDSSQSCEAQQQSRLRRKSMRTIPVGPLEALRSESRSSVVMRGRRRTREADLFEGADIFDVITKREHNMSIESNGSLERVVIGDCEFSELIVETAVKRSIAIGPARDRIAEHVVVINQDYMRFVDWLRACSLGLAGVSTQVLQRRNEGFDALRHQFRFHLAYYTEKRDWLEVMVARMQDEITLYARLGDFLKSVERDDVFLDLANLRKKFLRRRPDRTVIEKIEKKLEPLVVRVARLQRNDTTPLGVFTNPQSKTGQILYRFVDQQDRCYFQDVSEIADVLYEKSKKVISRDDIIRLMFDLSWEVRAYPLAPEFPVIELQDAAKMCPKIFNPPFLSDEVAMMTFTELHGVDWPLKEAVDRLFTIMILTNPLDIAQEFYDIIQEIGKGVQSILVAEGQDTQVVDIDFDQLFVLMIICIFASGLRTITKPMAYAYSFKDYAGTDGLKIYAMSHMEGLCMHFASLDWTSLRKRSEEIQRERVVMAMGHADPLGVSG